MEGINGYDGLLIALFGVGYLFITLEHFTKINKAAIALLMAILCWIVQFSNQAFVETDNLRYLGHHLSNVGQIIFFLLGALAVVEIISVHNGFSLISDYITSKSKRKLLWTIGIITFFLSSVLDNLTTTIVMVTFLRKLIGNKHDRLLIGGGVVIAANAGGAWTPIGDVTTTMLWIGNQITSLSIMRTLFLPSVACFAVSFLFLHFMLNGENEKPLGTEEGNRKEPYGRLIFWLGIGLLMFVPVFKILTGLPPFMGILFALGMLWLVTDILHAQFDDRDHLRVPHVLTRVDISSTLFFFGILLCIDALDSAGVLHALAQWFDSYIGNTQIIAVLIGLASAVVDNVPLVAASMGMYELAHYPTDSTFWNLIAYCAGTGGSILIIGSAAGVAFMGIEKVNFFWFMRHISLPALFGYLAGIAVYLLM